VLVGRSGSQYLSDTGLQDLKHLRKGIVECIWEVSGPRLVLLSSCFRSGVRGVKYCWNRLSYDFSFRNKFIIVLPYGLLLDNNTF